MAFQFNDCLIPIDFGTNQIFAACCVDVTCKVTNTGDNNNIVDLQGGAFGGNFVVSNLFINGAPPSFPFFVPKGGQFELSFTLCPISPGLLTDTVFIKIWDSLGSQPFEFAFETTPFESTIDISSINFVDVPTNSSASQQINLINPTIDCRFYDFSTSCPETVLSEISMNLCQNDQGAFVVTWSPSAAGNINCDVVIETRCFNYTIPLTGSAVEPPSGGGGNPVSGPPKPVVDCPTGDCRLFNPQPGFSQKVKNAINQISRATSPKGGPGRGTNFGRK